MGFSHLREDTFGHSFDRTTLMNELNNINNAINLLNSTDFIILTLYGDKKFDNVTSFKIIIATIKFIKTTEPFEEALF